jgi:hypothetical protein
MSSKHLMICGALVAIGIAAAIAGFEALGVLVALVCPLMMVGMVVMMVRHSARGGNRVDH